MISDANKGITDIEYNHLDLPTKVTVTGANAGTIDYVYDAEGIKLKKVVSNGAVTEYCGNYVYSGNSTSTSLQFFNHDEGYVNSNGNNYDYIYQYKDHLGNVRLAYSDSDGNGSINPNTEISARKIIILSGLNTKVTIMLSALMQIAQQRSLNTTVLN